MKKEIWNHILELLFLLFIVLASFTVFILIARLSKKKQSLNAISLRSKVERKLAYTHLGEIMVSYFEIHKQYKKEYNISNTIDRKYHKQL